MIINSLSNFLYYCIFEFFDTSAQTCAKIVTLALAQLPGQVLSIWYLYLINVILYILCVKLNYNAMCCGFSVIAILLRILVIFAYLWRRGRVKPETKRRLTMYLKRPVTLMQGLRRVRAKCVHSRACMQLFVCNTARDIGEIFFCPIM